MWNHGGNGRGEMVERGSVDMIERGVGVETWWKLEGRKLVEQ